MSQPSDFGLLKKLNYPPYRIESDLGGSLVVCGGGGGSYKSGIPNKMELYELSRVFASDSAALPRIKNIASFDTENRIITSMDRHFNYLLTAEKDDICEYILVQAPKPEDEDDEVVKDEEIENSVIELKLHRKVVNCLKNLQKDVEISVVKYCGKSGSLILAGGNSGTVKIFQRYNEEKPMELVLMKEFHDVSEGKNVAIVDLDVSPSGEEFVSICDNADGRYARVWNIGRGVKVTELALTHPKSKKLSLQCTYKFKQCRYASTYFSSDRRPSFLLYATHHPIKRNPKSPSFMSVWGPGDPITGNDYELIDVISLGNNKTPFLSSTVKLVPTALSVSSNGVLSAIGSGEGQVDVYRYNSELQSLSLIYRLPCAHSFIVTDITFMPSSRVFSTGHEFEAVSVGIDNMVRYHSLASQTKYLRLKRLYSLLFFLVVMFFCDRVFLVLNLL